MKIVSKNINKDLIFARDGKEDEKKKRKLIMIDYTEEEKLSIAMNNYNEKEKDADMSQGKKQHYIIFDPLLLYTCINYF